MGIKKVKLYFDWLCERIGIQDKHVKDSQAINILYETKFRVCEKYHKQVALDESRIEDVLSMREKFTNDSDFEPMFDARFLLRVGLSDVSIFEIMVALADRMVYNCSDSIDRSEAFLIMFKNLFSGIDENDVEKLLERVKKFLNREYDKDGTFGLFPLKNPKKDQRKVEIWYQMMAYIIENF